MGTYKRWRSLLGEDRNVDIKAAADKKYNDILKVHNTYEGHGGVERTMHKLRQKDNVWEGMRRDVKMFIRECPLCQKMCNMKPVINTLPFRIANVVGPMVHLAIDTIGPFTEDHEGNTHIMVIQCMFTRFVELVATKSTDAATAAKELTKHIGRYGTPITIRTDNGTQFCNKIFKRLYELMGIKRIKITPYSHEENGVVERANQELERHLRMLVHEKKAKDSWSEVLPLVQRIYNTSDCSNIGTSPATLMFGNNLDIDKRMVESRTVSEMESLIGGRWLDSFLATQERMIKRAKQIQQETHLRDEENRKHVEGADFKIDGYVLLKDPAGKGDKLDLPWTGPWRCIMVEGNTVEVMNLVYNRARKINKKWLKPFIFDPLRTDPREEACKDEQEYDVGEILGIRGLGGKKSDIEVRVRWLHYGSDKDSWLPWKDIKDVGMFHEYLIERGLKKLLPEYARRTTENN
jgi:hypothetical protein